MSYEKNIFKHDNLYTLRWQLFIWFLYCFHSSSPSKDQELKKPEPKKSDSELHWEELKKSLTRPLMLCDLDFTDLHTEDDNDNSTPRVNSSIPPPPPPLKVGPPPPILKPIPPPAMMLFPSVDVNGKPISNGKMPETNGVNSSIKKNKKTVSILSLFFLLVPMNSRNS